MIRPPLLAAALVASLLPVLPVAAQSVLFSDDFDTNTAANWTVKDGSVSGTPDFSVQFNYDYSQKGIPAAPNATGGTTRGVWMTVNKDDTAEQAAVSIFPTGKTFSGNYALRFDMWLGYNGPAYGGTGSTEFATFGINHSGDFAQWSLAPDSDGGLFFAVTGEGGAARDWRAYLGSPGGAPLELRGAAGGFLDRDGDSTVENEAFDANAATSPLRFMFPSPPFGTPEAPGKRWVQGEVRQQDGKVTWVLNGYVIAQRDFDALSASGNISLGNMDIFASIADPKADNFVIFDNVKVVNLDTAGTALAQVNVEATSPAASEPNVPAVFTISRTGSTAAALDVPFFLYGTATRGLDYATNNLTASGTNFVATILAGTGSVTVTLNTLNDQLAEDEETIHLALISTPGTYEVGPGMIGKATIANVGGGTSVELLVVDGHAYEGDAEDKGKFRITRTGDITGDLSVSLAYSGTASAADYDGAVASVVIPAGSASVDVELTPKGDALVEGSETIVVEVKAGAGYVLGAATTGTITLRDAEVPTTAPVFADNFDTDSSANWQIVFGAANNIEDYDALFAYDYSADSIPPSPHSGGTTKGLKVTVNKKDATATGAAAVNVYAKGKNFTGNHTVKFDLWINVDLTAAGTTEHALMGINHSGTRTNRASFPGGDGLWFAAGTDGSSSALYRHYVGNHTANPTSETIGETQFTSFFTAPPFLAPGAVSGHWVDGEITQRDGVATLKFNGVPIFTKTNATSFNAGTIMLGHADLFNSIGSPKNFSIFDNVRVYAQAEPPKPIVFQPAAVEGGDIVLTWTGGTGTFEVQGKLDWGNPEWLTLKITTERSARIPITAPFAFLRVTDGSTKSVKLFKATLNAAQEVANPAVNSPATGSGLLVLDGTRATYVIGYRDVAGGITAAHLHGPAAPGANAGAKLALVVVTGTREGVIAGQGTLDATTISALEAGNTYNFHSSNFTGGEIRGQVLSAP
jgi:hypothetical protein